MPPISTATQQYRDGVFSASSPAPRYGTLLTAFEDGSLGEADGDLDGDASTVLNKACELLIQELQPAKLNALPAAARDAAADASALASFAIQESDITKKMVLCVAASYRSQFFGLPRTTLAYSLDEVFGSYAMSASQRRAIHQQGNAALDLFIATKKGSPMSGVYKDGILGSLMFQPRAVRDGSLGALMAQNVAFRDGSLGRARGLRGLGSGCGCSGVGDDAAATATVTPFYKKPVVLAVGAAVGLGVVLYALNK